MRHVRHVLESLESRLLLDSHPVIDFGAEIEPNDTRETATPLLESPVQQLRPCFLDAAGVVDCPPTLYSGHGVLADHESAADSADVDFWSIRLAADSSINLRMEGSPESFVVLPELQDADGQVVSRAAAQDENGDGIPDSAALEFVAGTDGTFYIQIGPGDGPYALHAAVKGGTHDEHDPHVESEPNDTFETAQEIPLTWRNVEGNNLSEPRADSSVVWPAREASGFVRGSLENGAVFPDKDFYQIAVGPELTINVGASGAGAQGGHLAVYDQEHNLIADVSPAANGRLAATFESTYEGTYFVQLTNTGTVACFRAPCLIYELTITARREFVDPHNEHEPNDTLETANEIVLVSLPTFAPGIELRGGDARGIAGGPSHDQDVFGFEVQAGEHVTVGVTGFGSSLGECLPGFVSNGVACLHADERLPLFVYDHPIHVSVFDSDGNEVAESDGQPHVVSFDAAAAGQYFAVVSVSPDTDGLVRYRLGVLAQLTLGPDEVRSGEPPLEITLRPGKSFRYTDSDGDAVQIVFQGRGGTAHIVFDGPDANGSDIASVVVVGVRSGGNFRIRTSGSAEVGSLEIDGLPGRARRTSNFGNVSIDGNLGSFASSLSLRSLAVDGILGEVSAPGRQIGQVSAMVFDQAMADVGSIGSLRVEHEMSLAIFDLFLPADEQP